MKLLCIFNFHNYRIDSITSTHSVKNAKHDTTPHNFLYGLIHTHLICKNCSSTKVKTESFHNMSLNSFNHHLKLITDIAKKIANPSTS